MRVVDGRSQAPADLRGASIALGVLDGVHRGHQAVLAAAQADAVARGAPAAAAVFEPHPRHYFQPSAAPFRLQSARQRAATLTDLGAAAVFQIPFDHALAQLSAEDFVREIIVGAIGAKHVSVGFDFRFGRDRAGDAEMLKALGATSGFDVTILPAVTANGARISSSAVRELVSAGDVTGAAALLGRPFAIEGTVITGAQRGRTINFPTANVKLGDYIQPRFGVYAVRLSIEGQTHRGVANIGVKPTVGSPEPLLEAHVFDYSGDLYGKTIETALVSFIRPEQKFANFDALRAQIETDAQTARAQLAL